MATSLSGRARYNEARRLTEAGWRIMDEIGMAPSHVSRVRTAQLMGRIAVRANDMAAARVAYGRLDAVLAPLEPLVREPDRPPPVADQLPASHRRPDEAITTGERAVAAALAASGRDSDEYANALGTLADVYVRVGRVDEGLPRLRERSAS